MKLNLGGKIIEVKSVIETENFERYDEEIKDAVVGDTVGIQVNLISDNKGFFQKLFGNSNETYNILKNYKGKRVEFF